MNVSICSIAPIYAHRYPRFGGLPGPTPPKGNRISVMLTELAPVHWLLRLMVKSSNTVKYGPRVCI